MTAVNTKAPTQRSIDSGSLVAQARGGPPQPVPVLEFGGGRKRFWDVYNPPSAHEKPGDGAPDPYFDGPGQW